MKTNLKEALDIRFDSDAGTNITIRDYFRILLETLWDEGEGFSGKRPFGNSAWEYELYTPLVKHGFVRGTLDEDGYIESFDSLAANQLVFDLIQFSFKE
jgi:hypothetical protein